MIKKVSKKVLDEERRRLKALAEGINRPEAFVDFWNIEDHTFIEYGNSEYDEVVTYMVLTNEEADALYKKKTEDAKSPRSKDCPRGRVLSYDGCEIKLKDGLFAYIV